MTPPDFNPSGRANSESPAPYAAPLPIGEAARLRALEDLYILDSGHDERFDRVARLVQAHFGMPVVRISFVDAERTWFKACIGMTAPQAPRQISICSHTILSDDVLVIHNLSKHPIFRESPQVTGGPQFRFYAGAPIVLDDGHRVGSVCLMDYEAREEFDDRDEAILKDFASIVVHELTLHRQIAVADLKLAEAENHASRAWASNAEALDYLMTEVKQPVNAIRNFSTSLINELKTERPDCAELARAIDKAAARIGDDAERFAQRDAVELG